MEKIERKKEKMGHEEPIIGKGKRKEVGNWDGQGEEHSEFPSNQTGKAFTQNNTDAKNKFQWRGGSYTLLG